jgi:UDP-glucose 4-epimerase
MAQNIVLTGATGFIGASILAELLTIGANVMVLLRSDSDLTRIVAMKGFKTITYSSLLSKETIQALREQQPDIFIHCAWSGVGGHQRNEASQILDNIPLTLEAVELAAASGCKQWIGLGSQAEYGNQNRRMNEDCPLQPTTLYGKSKLAAGVAALALCEARKIAGVWMRVFSTYGPGDAPYWFIPYVIQEFLVGRTPKLTKCEQLWDYLYVTDAARAVVATANGLTSGTFNLGTGSAHPLKDYIEAIRIELGSTIEPAYGAVPYRQDQVMHLEADITRLTEITGWTPAVTIFQGIKKVVEFERTFRPPPP